MNSGTSTEAVRLKPGTIDKVGAQTDAKDDPGFKPWHFFVLASLAAATAAVLMSRQSTPAHLVLISFTIGAAGLAAAACYRMLAPLTVGDVAVLNERRSQRARALIEREKALVLRSIKELEFDRAMGKVSPKDFDEMSGRLRARAIMLMKQVDAGGSGYRELIERELSARLVVRAEKVKGRVRVAPPDNVRLKPDATRDATADVIGDGDNVRPKPDATAEDNVRVKPDAARETGACDACGTLNDPDAVFCKRCGARLEAVQS